MKTEDSDSNSLPACGTEQRAVFFSENRENGTAGVELETQKCAAELQQHRTGKEGHGSVRREKKALPLLHAGFPVRQHL